MNKDRILELADRIERGDNPDYCGQPLGFNMRDFVAVSDAPDRTEHGCQTSGCIAGWANAIWDSELNIRAYTASDRAQEILDLGYDQSVELFFGYPKGRYMGDRGRSDVTTAQASSCLRYLAETGRVVWDEDLREPVG